MTTAMGIREQVAATAARPPRVLCDSWWDQDVAERMALWIKRTNAHLTGK